MSISPHVLLFFCFVSWFHIFCFVLFSFYSLACCSYRLFLFDCLFFISLQNVVGTYVPFRGAPRREIRRNYVAFCPHKRNFTSSAPQRRSKSRSATALPDHIFACGPAGLRYSITTFTVVVVWTSTLLPSTAVWMSGPCPFAAVLTVYSDMLRHPHLRSRRDCRFGGGGGGGGGGGCSPDGTSHRGRLWSRKGRKDCSGQLQSGCPDCNRTLQCGRPDHNDGQGSDGVATLQQDHTAARRSGPSRPRPSHVVWMVQKRTNAWHEATLAVHKSTVRS